MWSSLCSKNLSRHTKAVSEAKAACYTGKIHRLAGEQWHWASIYPDNRSLPSSYTQTHTILQYWGIHESYPFSCLPPNITWKIQKWDKLVTKCCLWYLESRGRCISVSRRGACSTIGRDNPQSVLLMMDSSPELNRQKRSPRKAESFIWGEDAEGQRQQTLCGKAQEEEVHTTHLLIDTQVPAQSESQRITCTHRTLRCSALLERFNPDSPHQLLFPGIIPLSVYNPWDFTLNPKLQWFILCSKTFPRECNSEM